MSIETIVLNAVKDKFNKKGDPFRMKHDLKMDGSVCTENHKSPALVITRDTSGWKWHCHRCSESGFIGDKFVNPDATVSKVKQIQKPETPHETYIVTLPHDFIPLVEKCGDQSYYIPEVPFEAHSWLWNYNILGDKMEEFGFGWSQMYQMVILPLYSSDPRVLNGWIGRRILDKTKGKYHIQKPKGSLERLYFTVNSGTIQTILVEDCVSAIRVNDATGITTTALLTTSIDEDLTRKLQGKEVYVWLDADALSKSVKMVSRLRAFGIKTKHIYTSKDPKCYNNVAIKGLWNDVIATGNKSYSPGKEV